MSFLITKIILVLFLSCLYLRWRRNSVSAAVRKWDVFLLRRNPRLVMPLMLMSLSLSDISTIHHKQLLHQSVSQQSENTIWIDGGLGNRHLKLFLPAAQSIEGKVNHCCRMTVSYTASDWISDSFFPDSIGYTFWSLLAKREHIPVNISKNTKNSETLVLTNKKHRC